MSGKIFSISKKSMKMPLGSSNSYISQIFFLSDSKLQKSQSVWQRMSHLKTKSKVPNNIVRRRLWRVIQMKDASLKNDTILRYFWTLCHINSTTHFLTIVDPFFQNKCFVLLLPVFARQREIFFPKIVLSDSDRWLGEWERESSN